MLRSPRVRHLSTALALLAALALAGCGEDTPGDPPPGSAEASPVTYSSSGNPSVVAEQQGVGRDGGVKVPAGPAGRPVSTELERTDLEAADLVEMLDAPPLDAFEQAAP